MRTERSFALSLLSLSVGIQLRIEFASQTSTATRGRAVPFVCFADISPHCGESPMGRGFDLEIHPLLSIDRLASVGGGTRVVEAPTPTKGKNIAFVIDGPIGLGWRFFSAGDKPPPYGWENFIGITLSSVGVGASTTRSIRCNIFVRPIGSG